MLEITKEMAENMLQQKSVDFPEVMRFEYKGNLEDFIVITQLEFQENYFGNVSCKDYFYATAVKLQDLKDIIASALASDEEEDLDEYKIKWKIKSDFVDDDGSYIGHEEEGDVCDWYEPYSINEI